MVIPDSNISNPIPSTPHIYFFFLLLICDDLGILPQALISNIIADSLFRNYETAMQCSLRSKIWAAITDYSCYPKEPQTKDAGILQTKLEESESGVGNSEMIMFWCKSITNHLKSHKKFNETAQTDNITDYTVWHLNHTEQMFFFFKWFDHKTFYECNLRSFIKHNGNHI